MHHAAIGRASAVRVRAADPGDRARIAAFVDAHPDATAFHRPAWGEAVAQASGHRLVWLLAENRAGVLTGVLPGHAVHSALFGRALVSCGFAVDGGVLAEDAASAAALTAAFWQAAEQHGCTSAELRGGPMPDAPGWQVRSDAHAGFAGPLVAEGADADTRQLEAIPRKQRAEVRKGLTNPLEVRVGNGPADRAAHYAVYAESVRNLGTPVFPRRLFDAVLDAFGADADILTVHAEGRAVASVLSLYHRGTVMPYWGGGVWDARRLRANELMYYALMNHARRRGAVRFDFGRSKVDSGAYAFKKNWGFAPQPLAYAIRTADGQPPRDVNPNSPRYRLQIALWRRLPLALANRLGPLIANGLG